LLTRSAGAAVCAVVQGRRHSPDAATYAGKGKVEEVAAEVAAHEADLVIFNHELSAGQERNLEQALQCRVIDRTSLILDIFAQRAQSAEGKLQVELAQLEHLSTRLVRGWTHLERQKGGIGLRGPGETQLETDRRLLGMRVKSAQGTPGQARAPAWRAAQGARPGRVAERVAGRVIPMPANRRCSMR
jgi:GTP-binding protein HflX